jgi:hypothetical protein
MKLFHWNMSETLKQYACGDIVVMAETVEQARIKAFDGFIEWIKDEDSSLNHLIWFQGTENWDEDCEEEYQEVLQKLKDDLSKEPLDKQEVIFIMGSS